MAQTNPGGIQRVGVVGGGQLAWMMGFAAKSLGIELVVQTPKETDPAVGVAQAVVLADVADVAGTQALANQCDVVTFENEFIDGAGLQALADGGVIFRPGLGVLTLVLDKLHQRQFFDRIGLPNPHYVDLESEDNDATLTAQASTIGFPLVMKTRRLGYDGYGTFVVKDQAQLQAAWAKTNRAPILLEEFVPFKQELAIMVARSAQGEIAVYPTVETQQVAQICRRVLAPARVSAEVARTMEQFAHTLVEQLVLVGIIGIEAFLTQDDQILINEIAPRTHNSGHYTLEACQTSQFEQQLRAVSDRPLGPTDLICLQAVMINLLGLDVSEAEHHRRLAILNQQPQAQVYWYGKAPRPGRKLGHITRCLGPTDDPAVLAHALESIWYSPSSP
ncbi:MAG: 5-(carboxyamino)imidazole ribonucleotide synthase [Nodosilinea sp.]